MAKKEKPEEDSLKGKAGKEPEAQNSKAQASQAQEAEKAAEEPAKEQENAEDAAPEGEAPKDPVKAQIEELKDKCMRQMAEFENFRKRTDKEKAQMFDTGAAHVIEKILPVVDNFERGLATAPADEGSKAFAEGMSMIYKQLTKALEDLGVTPIEALGQEYDPNLHNAVMQTEATEEYPAGTVAQEMQKGYMYHDTVIRHSMVAVAG